MVFERLNTFAFTIRVPGAVHCAVYDVAEAANTPEEFYRLFHDRKAQSLLGSDEQFDATAEKITKDPT